MLTPPCVDSLNSDRSYRVEDEKDQKNTSQVASNENSSFGLERASGYSHSINSRNDSKHDPIRRVSIITPKLKLDPDLLAKNLQQVAHLRNISNVPSHA